MSLTATAGLSQKIKDIGRRAGLKLAAALVGGVLLTVALVFLVRALAIWLETMLPAAVASVIVAALLVLAAVLVLLLGMRARSAPAAAGPGEAQPALDQIVPPAVTHLLQRLPPSSVLAGIAVALIGLGATAFRKRHRHRLEQRLDELEREQDSIRRRIRRPQ